MSRTLNTTTTLRTHTSFVSLSIGKGAFYHCSPRSQTRANSPRVPPLPSLCIARIDKAARSSPRAACSMLRHRQPKTNLACPVATLLWTTVAAMPLAGDGPVASLPGLVTPSPSTRNVAGSRGRSGRWPPGRRARVPFRGASQEVRVLRGGPSSGGRWRPGAG